MDRASGEVCSPFGGLAIECQLGLSMVLDGWLWGRGPGVVLLIYSAGASRGWLPIFGLWKILAKLR